MITSLICYVAYNEMIYTPLEKKDFQNLFPNYEEKVDVIFHEDFTGWSHGDFFELFVYRITNMEINSNYPIVGKDWEYISLSDMTEIIKWSNCPVDSITQLKYEYELTWIMNSEIKERKMLEQDLKDENNYYSYIYVSELQKYFLLYNPLKGILYYIRQNGF